MPDPSENPVPEDQAMELENLPLPAEWKPWFDKVLRWYGFPHIADAINQDESEAWFSAMFCGCLQGLAQATDVLNDLMGAQMAGPGQPQEGVAVVEQDKRLVLPGDPEY